MVIGALAALSLAKLTGRMWIKPYTMAVLAVLASYVFTTGIMGGIGTVLGAVSSVDGDSLVNTFAPLIGISPYHIGGELLRPALGGSTDLNPVVLVLPIMMLAVFGWLASKVYPNVYEKE
jgi:hypothetical protein